MAAHRYWRFYFPTIPSGGNGYAGVGEVELKIVANGADVTGSGTAIASSYYPGYTPDKAFANDGVVRNTQSWFSNTTIYPHWLGYDFGAEQEKDIIEYSLTATDPSNNEMPTTWNFQWSDDAVSWNTLGTETGIGWGHGMTKTFTLTGQVFPDILAVNTFLPAYAPGALIGSGTHKLQNFAIPAKLASAKNASLCAFVGTYTVSGVLTVENEPRSRKVRLHNLKTGELIAQMWSDPVTGYYEFNQLELIEYYVWSEDYTRIYEPVTHLAIVLNSF